MLAERTDDQARIDREASEWLARREMTRLTLAEVAEFEVWQSADPRHARAFEAVSRALAEVASLRSLADLEPIEPARPAWRGRAGMGAMAACLGALIVAPAVLDRPDIQASTLIAEVRPITLADGTRVTLGASSEIKVSFDRGERRVRLVRGEAFFDVADDKVRPFVVDAGGTEIRDIGTSFDVKRTVGKVEVGVLSGIVDVRPKGLLRDGPARRLIAGQRVRAQEEGLGPIVTTARIGAVELAPAAAGGWREGQLTYDDTRLADLVADLNRYYGPGVKLASADLGDVRLAAAFKTHEIDKFLAELPSVAPVRVLREGDGVVVIAPRASASPSG